MSVTPSALGNVFSYSCPPIIGFRRSAPLGCFRFHCETLPDLVSSCSCYFLAFNSSTNENNCHLSGFALFHLPSFLSPYYALFDYQTLPLSSHVASLSSPFNHADFHDSFFTLVHTVVRNWCRCSRQTLFNFI